MLTAPVLAMSSPAKDTTVTGSVTWIVTNTESFASITGLWYRTNGAAWIAAGGSN